jgi:hypothetical protein
MIDPGFPPNTRVRLLSAAGDLELRTPTGHIVGPDNWLGYYIVRLDVPARFFHTDGHVEDVAEISEAADNMEPIGPTTH